MVQFAKSIIPPEKQEIIKQLHGKATWKEIAKKVGVPLGTLKRESPKIGLPKLTAGAPEVSFEDQKVPVYISVKRKHYTKALIAAQKATKQFR